MQDPILLESRASGMRFQVPGAYETN